jgi:hypothetical protein
MPDRSAIETGCETELPPDAAVAADNRNPRRRDRQQEAAEVGVLTRPEPRHDLDALVLHPEAKADILAGLRAIERRADLDRIWNLSAVQPMQGRCILNFYGDPGTGKTRAALGIALRLGRPLYQVDYSAVISKYLGDTAKHIARAFGRAADLGAVLFFDEADSLLSRRVDMNESCATSINQNRNVLMQCLDRFDGVVIMTTNLFGNYDPALLRRIARHVEFRLPNRAMRRRLFELHLPNRDRVSADLGVLAGATRGLSGGDILNVCVNAIFAGSTADDPAQWAITNAILLAEIAKVREAKRQHGERPRPAGQRAIGYVTPDTELEA